ncbi:MAG: hypothetical protein U0359_37810 [Byssovorax sp.]
MPPDLLKPGTTYVIQVVANTGSSVEAPFKIAPTSGSATAVTGIFTP